MSPPTWYSITDLAAATGLPVRTIRDMLDKAMIFYWQPAPNAKRLLTDRTVRDLEALGLLVDRDALRQSWQSRQDSQTSRDP